MPGVTVPDVGATLRPPIFQEEPRLFAQRLAPYLAWVPGFRAIARSQWRNRGGIFTAFPHITLLLHRDRYYVF